MAKASKALNKAPGGKAAGEVTDRVEKTAGFDQLGDEVRNLAGATATWALTSAVNRLDNLTDRLSGNGAKPGPGAMAALTGGGNGGGRGGLVKNLVKKAAGAGVGALTGKGGGPGKRGGGNQPKMTNIVETIDIGAPVRLVYDQWTRFTEFPRYTKKVENVSQEADEKLVWHAKIFWSKRSWESTIVEQIPDQRIIWRSKGAKGYVDGAVTFHELAPELTRVVLVLEYNPQGLFERTGNIWRAQGRRARLELKHFRRHVMTQVLLHPDEVEGWRGEIRDGEVVSTGTEEESDDAAATEDEPDDLDERDELDEPEDEELAAAEPDDRDEVRDEDEDRDEVHDEDEDTEQETERPRPARAKSRRTSGGRPRTTKARKPAAGRTGKSR